MSIHMALSVPQGAHSSAVPAVGPVVELPALLTPMQHFVSVVQGDVNQLRLRGGGNSTGLLCGRAAGQSPLEWRN